MNEKYKGLTVTNVSIHANYKGFTVSWIAPRIGFGDLTVWIGDYLKVHMDTECMSNEFASLVHQSCLSLWSSMAEPCPSNISFI